MDYEVYNLAAIIAKAYEDNSSPSNWFSLKEAADHYGPSTDAFSICDQLGKDRKSVYKLLASKLRQGGLHIGARAFIGGHIQRPVWSTPSHEMAFFRARLLIGPKSGEERKGRTTFDLEHKWIIQ